MRYIWFGVTNAHTHAYTYTIHMHPTSHVTNHASHITVTNDRYVASRNLLSIATWKFHSENPHRRDDGCTYDQPNRPRSMLQLRSITQVGVRPGVINERVNGWTGYEPWIMTPAISDRSRSPRRCRGGTPRSRRRRGAGENGP